jgi:predicted small lipoprotein YifL
LYGAARIGDFVVISINRPTGQGWAIILLSAAVLALGGCGRKGPLDLPPNTPPQAAAAAQANADHEPSASAPSASAPSVYDPSYGANSQSTTPKGQKRPFVLDPLLNSN